MASFLVSRYSCLKESQLQELTMGCSGSKTEPASRKPQVRKRKVIAAVRYSWKFTIGLSWAQIGMGLETLINSTYQQRQ